jgi:hypothetical protein
MIGRARAPRNNLDVPPILAHPECPGFYLLTPPGMVGFSAGRKNLRKVPIAFALHPRLHTIGGSSSKTRPRACADRYCTRPDDGVPATCRVSHGRKAAQTGLWSDTSSALSIDSPKVFCRSSTPHRPVYSVVVRVSKMRLS